MKIRYRARWSTESFLREYSGMIEIILFLVLIAVAILFGLFMPREKSAMSAGQRKGKSVRFDEGRNEVYIIEK
jgi:hypothetical protein